MDVRGIEVQGVAEEDLSGLDKNAGESDDLINNDSITDVEE